MKTRNFLTTVIIAVLGLTSPVVAQVNTERNSDYDMVKNVKLRVIATSSGCDVVCESSSNKGDNTVANQTQSVVYVHEETSSTEKIVQGKHFPKATLSTSNSDAGSGKVNVQDISFHKSSGGGSGKVSMQDFHFTVKCKGKAVAIVASENGFTMPENCPDGMYDMTASWSWGAHQSGTTSLKAIDCHLKIENGVCIDMAINEKGSSGTKSSAK